MSSNEGPHAVGISTSENAAGRRHGEPSAVEDSKEATA